MDRGAARRPDCLGLVTILKYKSPAGSSFRPGDLIRLWSYGAVYDAAHVDELPSPSDLTLALVIPSVTPTLTKEIARMGWTLTALGGGYGRIDGAVYALYVVATDEVSQAEHDEFLELFSRRELKPSEATRWLGGWLKEERVKEPNMTKDEERNAQFMEVFKRIPLVQRLEMFEPEELLGLDPDQQTLALPVEVLRGLTEAYILSLSPETQEIIRRRIRGGDH